MCVWYDTSFMMALLAMYLGDRFWAGGGE